MKTLRKYGVLAAVITALIAITLVIGCSQPIDSAGWGFNNSPAAGMGAVKVIMGNPDARTLVPTAPVLADFTHYTFEFTSDTATSGNDKTLTVTKAQYGSGSFIVNLTPDDYTLVVTAHKDPLSGTANAPVAQGNGVDGSDSSILTVAAGSTLAVTVQLEMIDPGTTNNPGVFTYSFNLLALSGLSIGTMAVTARSTGGGSTPVGSPFNIIDTPSNTTGLSLNAGYYNVLLVLENDGVRINQRELLHIYPYMTTDFTRTFTTGDFPVYSGSSTTITPPPTISGKSLTWNWDVTSTGSNSGTTVTVSSSGTPTFGRIYVTSSDGALSNVTWSIEKAPFGVTPGTISAGLSSQGLVTGDTLTVTGGTAPFNVDGQYIIYVDADIGSGDPGDLRFVVNVTD